jgi:ankyrin repeat protein
MAKKKEQAVVDAIQYSAIIGAFIGPMETLEKDTLIYQYGKIAEILRYAQHLNRENASTSLPMPEGAKDALDTLNPAINYCLSNDQRALLEQYLENMCKEFDAKDARIIALQKAENQEDLITNWINGERETKQKELTHLEKSLSPEEQKAALQEWEEKQREEYRTAVKVYNNPDYAVQARARWEEQQATITARAVTAMQTAIKGEKRKNTEDYRIVSEGVLTAEEANLYFDYPELNTYGVYATDDANLAIFDLARQKGELAALGEISHEKIPTLLFSQSLQNALQTNHISFENIAAADKGFLARCADVYTGWAMLFDWESLQAFDRHFTAQDQPALLTCISSALQRNPHIASPLFGWAAATGHIDIVTHLLEKEGESILPGDKEEALHLAARYGHIDIVMHLLETEGENISPEYKGEALHSAAANGHIAIVTHLLEKEGKSKEGESIALAYKIEALRNATKYGHIAIVMHLLEIAPEFKGRVLESAAAHGHRAMVTHLLEKEGKSILPGDKEEALHSAARQGHIDIVMHLLETEGENISPEHKGKALRNAAATGHIAIVTHLLEKEGKNISTIDKIKALHAVKTAPGSQKITKELKKMLANPDATPIRFRDCYHYPSLLGWFGKQILNAAAKCVSSLPPDPNEPAAPRDSRVSTQPLPAANPSTSQAAERAGANPPANFAQQHEASRNQEGRSR